MAVAALCTGLSTLLFTALGAQTDQRSSPSSPEGEACSQHVAQGTAAGRAGDLLGAERALTTARRLCPDRAEVLRELAALRFRQDRYLEAADLAGTLVERASDDEYAWRLLAASRFLLDDREGALRAWNRLDRPLATQVRIEGIERSRPDAARRALGIHEGDQVTPEGLSRGVRRLELLPTVSYARVAYRPLAGDDLEGAVEAHLAERRSFPRAWPEVLAHGLRAVGDARIVLDASAPLGAGELWRADWRWRANHGSSELSLAVPGGGLPGVWSLRVGERTGLHRFSDPERSIPPSGPSPALRDVHRFVRVEASDWASSRMLWELGASLDHWRERGGFFGMHGALELRWPHEPSRERAALRVSGRGWRSPTTGEGFGAFRAQAVARSVPSSRRLGWTARVGVAKASVRSPPIIWTTAGAGRPSDALLRAHTSLDEGGVMQGPFAGPRLLHAGLELRRRLRQLGPVRIGAAVFAEGARVRAPSPEEEAALALDVGAGVRFDVPVLRGAFRADLAYGVLDGERRASLGWMPGWPGWWDGS